MRCTSSLHPSSTGGKRDISRVYTERTMGLLRDSGRTWCQGEQICGALLLRHLQLSYISQAKSDVKDPKEVALYSQSYSKPSPRQCMRFPMWPLRQPRYLQSPRSIMRTQTARTPTLRGSSAGLHRRAYYMGSCTYHRIFLSLAVRFLVTRRCYLDLWCHLHRQLADAHDEHRTQLAP